MNNEIFLIDANSLITPYLTFYPFDFAPGFWQQLANSIKNGQVAILDVVKAEILRGNDELKSWMNQLEIGKYIDHRAAPILQRYGEVLQHIQKNPVYKVAALTEWSRETVADPWLIATAASYNYTLITFEESNTGLSSRTPSKNAKIPDVAQTFGVKTEKLYYMMRELGLKLG